jgi:hypothetical protein
MNKKATSILMMIFELLVVVLVVAMTFSIAGSMAKGERVEKVVLAEEIRMMMNTLVSVSGEAVVEYPYNVSKYVFLLNENSVTVFVEGEDKVNWAVRTFYLPEGYEAAGSLKGKERACLEKTGRNIFLRECGAEEE